MFDREADSGAALCHVRFVPARRNLPFFCHIKETRCCMQDTGFKAFANYDGAKISRVIFYSQDDDPDANGSGEKCDEEVFAGYGWFGCIGNGHTRIGG
jgi:hypothetical protein